LPAITPTPFVPPEAPAVIRELSPSGVESRPLELESNGFAYVVSGNTLLRSSVVREALLRAANPRDAVANLNEAYHKAGYFLVAIKARLNGNKVLIQVIQGQLTQLKVAPGLRWFFESLRYRPDLRQNDVVARAVLANAYAQRNGQRVAIGFAPSSNPGGSEIQVTQETLPGFQPLTGNVFFGNYGSRYSSRYVTGGSLSYSPGLGLNLTVSGTAGLPTLTRASAGSAYNQESLNLSSITPWGTYGFNAQWTHYRLGDVAYPLNPTGKVFTWALTGTQLLYATESSRWTVTEGYNHVGNHVKVYQSLIPGGYPLTVQSYNYFDVGTQFNTAYRWLGKAGSFNASLVYNQGINGSHGTLNNQIPSYPSARFHYFDATLSLTQALPQGMTASLTASGQGAFNTLPQQNQWVLGGFGSLSAYYPGILVGDSGYSGRLQVQSPPWTYRGFTVSANAYAEIGGTTFTYLAPGQTPWQSLSDVGIGVSLQSPWGTNVTALSALPVGSNHVSRQVRRTSRVDAYFVLTQNF